jgi:hypothetical protein
MKNPQIKIQLLSEIEKKLKFISNNLISNDLSENEEIQVLISVNDDLEDILLHWEPQIIPSRLRNMDLFDD